MGAAGLSGARPGGPLRAAFCGGAETQLCIQTVSVLGSQEPQEIGVWAAIDCLPHDLQTQTPATKLADNEDVRQVGERAIADNARKSHLMTCAIAANHSITALQRALDQHM